MTAEKPDLIVVVPGLMHYLDFKGSWYIASYHTDNSCVCSFMLIVVAIAHDDIPRVNLVWGNVFKLVHEAMIARSREWE